MLGQWFANEMKEKFAAIEKKIQEILDRPVVSDERLKKLEDEIRAMKARMGKQKE